MSYPLYAPKQIMTFSRKYVNVFVPDLDTFDIIDIAHALSMICRYGGHSPVFFSVAEHCIWVCEYLERAGMSKEICFAGLMHDSSEAYLIDIPKPIKLHLSQYNELEDTLMIALAEKFEFQYPLSEFVKTVDKIALETEWKQLMTADAKVRVKTMTQRQAKRKFLQLYEKFKP